MLLWHLYFLHLEFPIQWFSRKQYRKMAGAKMLQVSQYTGPAHIIVWVLTYTCMHAYQFSDELIGTGRKDAWFNYRKQKW